MWCSGLSAVIGSWKIIPIRAPRIFASGAGRKRLAGTALADQAGHLAGAQRQVHALHRRGAVGALGQADGQAADVEDNVTHRSRSLGFRASFNPSPTRLID